MIARLLPLLLLLHAAAPAQAPETEAPGASAAADMPATQIPILDLPPPDAEALAYQRFVASLRPQALARGISAATFDAVAPTLSLDRRVVRADRAQPGGNAAAPGISRFAPYRDRHVDAARIGRGQAAYARARPALARVEAESGVPEAVAVAIWGHETDYGAVTGRYDLLRSLSSLAFEGRRRALFTAEFLDALLLIERGVPREQLRGSWAGATGYPQFLPSVYLRVARDGDGDGRADIWTSAEDALASIGNYLRDAGWKPGVRWGTAVTVPEELDRATIATRLTAPRCPRVFARHSRWLTIAEWKALGLAQAGGPWPADDELATLIEPDGPGETAYLLTVNYRAILDYNCSNFYALSVGLLADAVVN